MPGGRAIDKIRLLDAQTVNEIAAGEVIERPASVVKELMENSVDAGADRIEVRVEDGGIRRIEIIDNGEGMSREDALLAIRQHSTSKISRIEDLTSLSTYGFRGEALSSISSVSKVTIRSRTGDEEVGTELVTEFGSEPELSSVGAPVGTTVIVENLFQNIPARRKHLASAKTELSHIVATVTNYAVIRPEITFDLVSNGASLRSFRGPDRVSRIAELVGPKAAKRLTSISKQVDNVEISGALTKMDVTRSSPSSIHLFVNGRPVASPLLLSAIADGYGTRLMRGRYPIGYLTVTLSPGLVDVNIHPTKREVRFADPEHIRELIAQAIEDAFSDEDATPRFSDLMDYMKIGKAPEKLETPRLRPTVQARIEAEASESGPLSFPFEPLFQLFKTYVVATGADEDSVIIMDQHAAAERVQYESILRSLREGERRSQKLLAPSILELSPDERAALEENIEHLQALGFGIEPFGGGSFRLVSVPVVLGEEQGEKALKGVLDDIAKIGRRRSLGEEIIWKVACHGSIRAGQDLSRAQMRTLISDLLQTSNPYTCEHGRPTMISLRIGDLERLFKRQV